MLAHYGYYEIRAKPMNTNIVSAFWFYAIEPQWHTEIDVFEIPGGNEKEGSTDRMTIHIFKTPTFKGTDKDHIKSGERWRRTIGFRRISTRSVSMERERDQMAGRRRRPPNGCE